MLAEALIGRWLPEGFSDVLWLLLDASVCMGTAVICGYVVGQERTAAKATVGVRTHVLVCVGSAGFVHLGMIAALRFGSDVDIARLIQSMATGIGFLGAGAIFKNDGTVRGVNTATSIWIMGAAGTAAGCGAVALALFLSALAYLVLRWSGEPVEFDELFDDLKERLVEDLRDAMGPRGPHEP